MPAQPLKLDTFWNQVQHCRRNEPTSYPLVINDLIEQALGTGVALQYAPSYFLQITNAHLWLGAFFDERTGNWTSLDPLVKPSELLMITGKLSGDLFGNRGKCLSADPKTLGAHLARPCNDDTGAVICEMAPRPVCDGRTGGILPISPIKLDGNNIIPKMPGIPLFGQVLGGGGLI